MVQEHNSVTVEFIEKTSFGTAGVYLPGEVGTFSEEIAARLLLPNERTGKTVAKPYRPAVTPDKQKGLPVPPAHKQIKSPPQKKAGGAV